MANSQDYASGITWTQSWARHLAMNGGLTISSATAACTDGRVTVSGVVGSGTTVTFKVTQAGITAPTTVTIDVTAHLSNGDTDVRDFEVQFTDT